MSCSAVCLHHGRLPLAPPVDPGHWPLLRTLTPSSAHLCLHRNHCVCSQASPSQGQLLPPFLQVVGQRHCSEAPLSPSPQASLTGCVFSQEEPVAWPQVGDPPKTLFLSRSHALSSPSPAHGEEGQATACHMCPASAWPSGFPQACCPLFQKGLCATASGRAGLSWLYLQAQSLSFD